MGEGAPGDVQALANKALETSTDFLNGVYDLAEDALHDALKLATAVARTGVETVEALTKRIAGE